MSFSNETPYAALPVPLVDREGNDVLVAIVKATFVFDAQARAYIAPEQHPIRIADEPFDPQNPRSSLRYASDVAVHKPGCDVVIVGDAVSPRPTQVVDVAARVKQRTVALRVHGARTFFDAVIGLSIGPAQPFERMPIVYELAYGGMSDDATVIEPRNPAGVGVAKSTAELSGTRAPQIEAPERPHKSASDRHPPAGFGPIMSHWSPRRERIGTADERWQKTRMPLVPEDYDPRYENVAHPSLQFDEPIVPGEAVQVVGMSIEPFGARVPDLGFSIRARFDNGERAETRPPIDTVVVFPEARRLEIVARAALPIGRGSRVLREVVVRADG